MPYRGNDELLVLLEHPRWEDLNQSRMEGWFHEDAIYQMIAVDTQHNLNSESARNLSISNEYAPWNG